MCEKECETRKIWCEESSDDGTKSATLAMIPRGAAAVCPRRGERACAVPRTINSSTAVLSARSNSTSKLEAQPECARRANTSMGVLWNSRTNPRPDDLVCCLVSRLIRLGMSRSIPAFFESQTDGIQFFPAAIYA